MDNLADLRELDLPFDVDDVDPICHECIRKQVEKYDKFMTEDGESCSGKFKVMCSGIPKHIINPIERAQLTDEQIEMREAIADPVKFAAKYLKDEKGNPFIARDYQIAMVRCRSKRAVYRCGRRIGKTTAVVIRILHAIFTTRNLKVLVVGPQKTHAEEIFNRIREFINNNPILSGAVATDISSPYFKLILKNGSEVKGFAGGTKGKKEGSSVRGKDADLILLEEMDFIDNDAIQGAIMPILYTNADAELIGFSTPCGLRKTFYSLCKESPQYKEFHYTYKVLPWWKTIEAERGAYTEEQFEHEFLAEFGSSDAGVYKPAYIDKAIHNYKYRDCIPTGGWTYAMGVDWNEKHGAEIIVLGHNPFKKRFRIVDQYHVAGSEFTQLNSVAKVIEINKKWRPKFIYVDAGNGCLYKDSIIQTESGTKQIKDIEIGDKVLTKEGRYRKVISAIKTGTKESYKIKAGFSLSTTVSKNHKHIIYRSNKRFLDFPQSTINLQEVITEELNPKTDFLVIPKQDISKSINSCVIDLVEELSGKVKNLEYDDNFVWTSHGFATSQTISVGDIIKEFKTSRPTVQRTRRKVKTGERLTSAEQKLYDQLEEKYPGQWNSPSYKKTKRYIDICSKDFQYVFGWYLSEGHAGVNSIEITQMPFHYKKEFNKLISICSKMWDVNLLIRERGPNKGCQRLFIQNTIISELFKKLGGTHAENKFIDKRIVDCNPIELVKTIFYGDGSIHKYGMTLALTSFDLIFQVRQILINNGLVCGTHYIKPRKNNRIGRWANYRTLPQMMISCSSTYNTCSIINQLFNFNVEYRDGIKRRKYIETNKFFLVPLKQLEYIGMVDNMYDLEIEEDCSFCVNGFATHNSSNYELLMKNAQNHALRGSDPAAARMIETLKKYDSGSSIETVDSTTHDKVKKPAKAFMVFAAVRLFENLKIEISNEDQILEKQFRNYIIERYTPNGNPVFGLEDPKVGDHRLDAFNLACVAFQLEFNELFRQVFSASAGAVPDPRRISPATQDGEAKVVERPAPRDLVVIKNKIEEQLFPMAAGNTKDPLQGIKTSRPGWDSDTEYIEIEKFLQRRYARNRFGRGGLSGRPKRSNI